MGSDKNRTLALGLGLAYLVVDANARSIIEGLELKKIRIKFKEELGLKASHQLRPPGNISSDQRTCIIAPDVQQWSEQYLPQSNSLIENWNGQ